MSENDFEKKREYTIIVNGAQKIVTDRHITYTEVVNLAYSVPPTGDNILFTITYEDGPQPNPQGSLLEGQRVQIDNGMIFNVSATNKS